MSRPALVDSCVIIGLLRAGLDPAVELLCHAGNTELATCGMVRMEVLRGVIQPKAKRAVERFFDVMRPVGTDSIIWQEAADLAWRLDREGWTLPTQDILIAACALRIGAAVFTHDKHFRVVPGLSVISSLEELEEW